MRPLSCWPVLGALAACATGPAPGEVAPGFVLPDSVTVIAARSGSPVQPAELLRRLTGADLVLLGELHDNPVHHQARGALLAAARARMPAVVFEQFPATAAPIPPPDPGQALEAWLDAHGFDRTGWRWPLHRPVVEAARAHARSIWGGGVARERLRAVVRGGIGEAPERQRRLLERAPLDSAGRAALDAELVAGHCGRLPDTMVPGMRAAQEVRDAALSEALLSAVTTGPAWLIAGNGHVRSDLGVPRLLRVAAPEADVVVVGFLERRSGGAPERAELGRYDYVVVTPPAKREDPCRANADQRMRNED